MKGNITRVCKTAFVAMFAFLFIAAPLNALEERKPDIRLAISAQKEIMVIEDGQDSKKLVDAENTKSGDVLLYRIIYRNEGNAVAVNPSIVDPVPEDTVYIIGSAAGDKAAMTFSINGGKSYSKPPVTYKVKTPEGEEKEVEAPAEMYTHIKWMIQETVKPGESGELSFRVTIE